MKKINNLFKLDSRAAIYVPSTIDGNKAASGLAEKMVEQTAARLSELFGGATISLAAGAWMSAEHGLIREQITIVYSYCTAEQLDQHTDEVIEIAEHIKEEMRQEAVSVEINNALYFV